MKNGTSVKWIVGALLSVVLFGGGVFLGDRTVGSRLAAHEVEPGHPVMVERVQRIEEDVKEELVEINRKLDRLWERGERK